MFGNKRMGRWILVYLVLFFIEYIHAGTYVNMFKSYFTIIKTFLVAFTTRCWETLNKYYNLYTWKKAKK